MSELNFDNLTVLVVGDLMVDCYLQGSVSRISPEAPVPVVLVNRREKKLGGAGNVAHNLLSLGARVRLISCVGDDTEGRWIAEHLKNNCVEMDAFFLRSDMKTSVKTRVTAQNQQLLRYDDERITFVPGELVRAVEADMPALLEDVQAVIISDYGKGVVTFEMAQMVIAEANKRNIPVFVDPKGNDYAKYAGAFCCTPNLKELREVSGMPCRTEQEIFTAGSDLCRSARFDYMLVTRSEKGLSLIKCGEAAKQDFPAAEKEVIDVTGAGDTVISVFALCVVYGMPLPECCILANVAASIVCSKFGAATVTVREIDEARGKRGREKTITAEDAVAWADMLRAMGKRIVFTNGCFDIVHAGHVASLHKARSQGDALIVGVNSDASVRRLKGPRRPIVGEQNRLRVLEALHDVDRLVLFDEDTPEKLIEAICPDVLVKGKDWAGKEVAGGRFVERNGGKVVLIDLEEGLSTTNVIQKILDAYGEGQQV